MLNPIVLLALGILIGAAATGLYRARLVSPLLLVRFTLRLIMFPFQLSHEITTVLYCRVFELVTGVPIQIRIEDMRRKPTMDEMLRKFSR